MNAMEAMAAEEKTTQVPLIWTKHGNVPIETLDYHHTREDEHLLVVFREYYTDKVTGEIVKDSRHLLPLPGWVESQAGGGAGSFS